MLIIGCGSLLYYSSDYSGGAVWSLLFGSHGASCWEIYKPLGLLYLFWILIELSYLRPSLKRFVCAKAVGMYVLCMAALTAGAALKLYGFIDTEQIYWAAAAISVPAAQWTGYKLYYSSKKIEWLWIPMLISIVCMFFMLLFLSFFPPDNFFFREL